MAKGRTESVETEEAGQVPSGAKSGVDTPSISDIASRLARLEAILSKCPHFLAIQKSLQEG
jgi:hypothetical protein